MRAEIAEDNEAAPRDDETAPPVRLTPLNRLTTHLAETYAKCGLAYESPPRVERRVLTKNSRVTGNNGWDNAENNIVLRVRDLLGVRSRTGRPRTFVVLDLLGQGTFGQVFRCQDVDTKELVAIKIIRNHPSYYKQALVEIHVSMMLCGASSTDGSEHIVQLRDHFMFQNHLCLVFELLSINLYELTTQNSFRGLPLTVVRGFLIQILKSLVVLGESNVIHCDLKPENILLCGGESVFTITDVDLSKRSVPMIKLVDFGSACYEDETVYSYIQSRFYRSPEVLLGLPYNGAIDMWSLGCIRHVWHAHLILRILCSAEMFLGLPLFPGVSDYDQLRLIVETIDAPPPHMLDAGRNVRRFYHANHVLKTPDEYAAETRTTPTVSKRYFKHSVLGDIVRAYPIPRSASTDEREREIAARHVFCHFLRGLLVVDPAQRWTPEQALAHPFVTGDAFDPAFEPPPLRRSPCHRHRVPMLPMPSPQWACYSAPRSIPAPILDPYYSYAPMYAQSCPMPICHPLYMPPEPLLYTPMHEAYAMYPYEMAPAPWEYPPPLLPPENVHRRKGPLPPFFDDDVRPRRHGHVHPPVIHTGQHRKGPRRRKHAKTPLEAEFQAPLDL
ncbi:serine/threonine-protein kinase minibrain [Achlya hypogyna]|uniref:Serine/threonine-protein kinase minibrain n=1 Tax=Achlya hypogyna TaxID=1202772 RepID=A0A1V9YBF3_ACHHY|nr:serine/threonine-protein kinase minibrain [Achlya hypogyna]